MNVSFKVFNFFLPFCFANRLNRGGPCHPGDILIELRVGTEELFHFVFNTGMLTADSLVVSKYYIEKVEKDSRFCNTFQVKLLFQTGYSGSEELTHEQKVEELDLFMQRKPKSQLNGRICFLGPQEKKIYHVEITRDIGNPTNGVYCMKGGWLTKRGHKVRNWKRRWFVLKGNTSFSHLFFILFSSNSVHSFVK